jgi:hypothetical protein
MSDIAWPSEAVPYEFSLKRYTKVFRATSVFGKTGQNIDMLNDRWMVSCSIGIRSKEDSAALEAFVNSLRSGSGVVLCHHFSRPEIRGVLTNPTTQATLKGSQILVLNAQPGDNLKAGDMLGVGTQLYQVVIDCSTTTNTLTVPIILRLRSNIPAGLSVVTSKPAARFRLSSEASTTFGPGGSIMGTTLEFVEVVN